MTKREKLLLAILVIIIFTVIGGIACNYYSGYGIDLILVTLLGILIFITIGVIMCSRSKPKAV